MAGSPEHNLRADRLGQWIFGDAYLVALGAVVQRARCVRGHVGTVAISASGASISVLHVHILVAAILVRIVIVPLMMLLLLAARVGAIDGRLPEAIAHPKAQLPLTIPLPFPLPFALLHRLLLLLPEVGEEDRGVRVVFGATGRTRWRRQRRCCVAGF